MAWTGREMVVWSGSGFTDGAAYDPAADRWRTIAPSPLAGRYYPATVWTGRELLVWGGDSERSFVADDGAAYDPGADRWRALPRAPVAARGGGGGGVDRSRMVVWGGIGQPGAGDNSPLDTIIERRTLLSPMADGAAYDPATDRWRTLEPVPLLGRGFPIAAWDGQGMILWGGLVVVSSPASASEGVRYTPLSSAQPSVHSSTRNAPSPVSSVRAWASWTRLRATSGLEVADVGPLLPRGPGLGGQVVDAEGPEEVGLAAVRRRRRELVDATSQVMSWRPRSARGWVPRPWPR